MSRDRRIEMALTEWLRRRNVSIDNAVDHPTVHFCELIEPLISKRPVEVLRGPDLRLIDLARAIADGAFG